MNDRIDPAASAAAASAADAEATMEADTEPATEPAVENVVVIGSGPAGYTAAVYLARAGLSPVVLASSVEAGGALMTTTEVENFPGFADGIMGPDLMEQMRGQAERFGAQIVYDDAVEVELTGDIKAIRTINGVEYRAHTVVLAMGSAYRKLGVEGEERLTGRGVSWCATCDGFFFKGKDIAVVGGGDSALEEAMFLTRFADSVTLLHRRDSLRASHIMQERALANPKIIPYWNAEVISAEGDDGLERLQLRDTTTGELASLDATGLFIAIGHDPRSELVAGQVDVDEEGYVLVEHPSTRTNLEGVFACGDLVDKRYRQAITAAGTGCEAALDAEHYLAEHGLADPVEEQAAVIFEAS
ncbi:thioredoxin-disulfide reductase [Agromyces sp. ISL-38]|uniref:thioredoxin-disulfide reductase n=1 Tax=Agromyces sp. ISL-38 TaxID=2819107 RepID=UPI0035AB7D00